QSYPEVDTKKSTLKYHDKFQDPKYSSIKNANHISSKLYKHKKNVYKKENKIQNSNSANGIIINKNMWANSLREEYSPKPFDFSMINKTENNYELKAKKKIKNEYDWSKEIRLSGRKLTTKVVPNYDLLNHVIGNLNNDNKHNNQKVLATCNGTNIEKQEGVKNNICLYNDYSYATSTQPPPKIMASKNNHTILKKIEKELLALPKSIKFTPMY
ncbi:conserved protein, unknown function, partial [Hepatocystis sp. ex Piliocolobus tephrosceles]